MLCCSERMVASKSEGGMTSESPFCFLEWSDFGSVEELNDAAVFFVDRTVLVVEEEEEEAERLLFFPMEDSVVVVVGLER
jgi:hypothetical protein